MKNFIAILLIITAIPVLADQAHDVDARLAYSTCTARAALRLDDGGPDYAPIARAVAAACRDSYRAYVRYMEQHHPAEPVPSDRDLAISAVQYERKFGPAPLAEHEPR